MLVNSAHFLVSVLFLYTTVFRSINIIIERHVWHLVTACLAVYCNVDLSKLLVSHGTDRDGPKVDGNWQRIMWDFYLKNVLQTMMSEKTCVLYNNRRNSSQDRDS